MSLSIQGHKIQVKNVEIYYNKIGIGDHKLLMIPGVTGIGELHFGKQLNSLDSNVFTIITLDIPGRGRSRPPSYTFDDDFIKRDAELAFDLMNALGFEKFSVMGWCTGGVACIHLAANHPKSVNKMILIGTIAYITFAEIESFEKLEHIGKCDPAVPKYHDQDFAQRLWSDWISTLRRLYETRNGDLCTNEASFVTCSTLIVQGSSDVFLVKEHAEYLKKHLHDSKVKIFDNHNHAVHITNSQEFDSLITEFLRTGTLDSPPI